MMKILITGASGFIGSAIFNRLIKDEMDVYGGTRHFSIKDRYLKTPSLDANADWLDVVKNFEVVVHTAGRAHILNERSGNPLDIFRAINTAGTIKLAKDCALVGVRRFIFISSIGVYGRSSKRPYTEKDLPEPLEDYSISKLEAEQGILEVGEKYGMEIIIIRPPLVYGAGAPGNFGNLFKAIINGWPLPFGSIGFNKRTFVSVNNLIDLVVLCIHHPKAANQIFLAADNETLSTAEFIQKIANAFGIRSLNIKVPYIFLAILFFFIGRRVMLNKLALSLEVSNRKALDMLGWSPPNSMQESLEMMFEEVRDGTKN